MYWSQTIFLVNMFSLNKVLVYSLGCFPFSLYTLDLFSPEVRNIAPQCLKLNSFENERVFFSFSRKLFGKLLDGKVLLVPRFACVMSFYTKERTKWLKKGFYKFTEDGAVPYEAPLESHFSNLGETLLFFSPYWNFAKLFRSMVITWESNLITIFAGKFWKSDNLNFSYL